METSNKSAGIYSLWFGLDYGSILSAFALYKVTENAGIKPYLIQKLPELWTDHYADKENIAGKFIYENCDVLEVFDDEEAMNTLENASVLITSSDILWDDNVVGNQAGGYFYADSVDRSGEQKLIAYGTSFGNGFEFERNIDRSYLLKTFDVISSIDNKDKNILSDYFSIDSKQVIDPILLCDRSVFSEIANGSVAHEVDSKNQFLFTYIKNGNDRKRKMLFKLIQIFNETGALPVKNFIDINRYPESKEALGLEPAYHILADDWLYYLINSEFVLTDDYYGVVFALLFEKNFAVFSSYLDVNNRLYTLLDALGLSERIISDTEDYKKKEYLFRKPIKYSKVNKLLDEMKRDSLDWFTHNLGAENVGGEQ